MNFELGKFIKEKREKKKISQRELAKIINVNNSYISRLEKGEIKKPSIEILKKLSKALDIYNEEFHYLVDISKYTLEEQIKLDLIIESIGISGTDKLNKYYYKINNNKIIDIVKVLKDYKKNQLNESEVIGLISCSIATNIFNYIPNELIKKYDIKSTYHIK